MKKTVITPDGKEDVEMSAEEEAVFQAERDAFAAALPLKKWLSQLAETDITMPRSLEDMIDVLSSDQRAALASKTLNAYNLKKQIRSQKP